MPRLPLIFPFAGRRDDSAHSEQPQLTTREARNVRGRDPVTGRVRGAQRSGMSKFNASAIGVGRIKALCSSAIDDRKVAYAFSAAGVDTAWSEKTPSKTNCLAGRVDAGGNVYALDGPAGIVKLNSAGHTVMKIALPVADPAHVVRALWVDDAGRIFAGVSEGGDVRKAAVFCVLQLQDDQYAVLWTLTPGAYTEDLRVYRGSQLYAAHNYPLENRARVLIYESIGLDPGETGRIESVAYPISGMTLGADGSVYCSSPDVQRSSVDTRARVGHPNEAITSVHPPLVGWKPTDLTDAAKRLWSWYPCDEIDATDVEQLTNDSLLEDGQQILRVRDQSANGRHFYAGTLVTTGEFGPLYRKVGIGGKPCAYFQNTAAASKHSLVTLPNSSIDKTLASQQRTAIPAYTGAMWTMLMVIRPTQDADVVTPSPRVVFAHDNQAAGGGSDHALFVNRNAETAIPGTYVQGAVSYYSVTDNTGDAGGSGTVPPHANEFPFKDFGSPDVGGAILVTIMWDGGIDPNDTTKTRCLIRVNGRPVDRFEGLPFASLEPSWFALAPTAVFLTGAAVERRFQGELAEIIVLDRKDRNDDSTEPKILTHDKYEPAVTADNTNQTDNELAQLEAYLAYKWGIGQVLRNNEGIEVGYRNYTHFYARNAITYGAGTARVGGPPKPGVGGLYAPFGHLLNTFALLSKHDAQGKLKWVWNWSSHADTTAAGGVGLGVAARTVESDGKTHVWSCGNQPANSNASVAVSTIDVRKVIDLGESFTGATADGGWKHTFAGGTSLQYTHPKLDADQFGNFFLPGYDTGASIRGLTIFSKDGALGLAVVRDTELFPSASDLAYAVAVPPDSLTPDYRTDLTEKIAEYVYLFTTPADVGSEEAIYKLRLVTTAALASGSTRSVHTIAVVEDDIRLISATTNTVPSGGSAAIDATAQYVQALRAGDDIVVLDGVHYLAYSLRDGTIAALESTSAGEIPPRGKLAMYWRHRLVIGCFADAPGNYAASRLGNIRDWNLNPGSLPSGEQIHTSTQAFTGTTTRAGEAEDSLVAMIPVWDDLAFLVCESKILRLTGDPQDGGNIHKVTDQLGGVFGDSWCVDASGRVFMFGNKPPGLYLLQPEGEPVPLTARSLEQSEFAAIDFSTNRIMLAWNPIDRGVHIFQVAWGTSAIVNHWFYEEATHRLVRSPPVWQDRINSATKQPTAVTYLGGDETRGLLLGCADGYVRLWDSAAETDDGTPIKSRVMFAPVSPKQQGSDFRLKETTVVLAADQGGARVEIFASETADDPGPPVAGRDIGPGLNEGFRARAKGAHLHVRVSSDDASRWAMEDASVVVVPAGRTVPRSP